MVKAVRRAWIPLVIIIVVAIAVFAVYRLHGVFGKTEVTRPAAAWPMTPSRSTPSR